MTTVRSYKDGNRLILVVENVTGETAKLVNEFLAKIHGIPVASEPVPAVVPEARIEEPIPEILPEQEVADTSTPVFAEPAPEDMAMALPVSGECSTLGEAIKCHDTRAVVALVGKLDAVDEALRQTAMTLCKAYIYRDCCNRDPDITGTAEIQKFFADYAPLIKSATKQILEQMGYADLRNFFDFEQEFVHQDAYRAILDNLKERTAP